MKHEERKELTKRSIVDSLVALTKQKGLKNVTVSDIVRMSKINRGTFYLHFKSISELVEWMEENFLDLLVDDFYTFLGPNIAHALTVKDPQDPDSTRWYNAITHTLSLFDEQRDIIAILVGPDGDPSLAPRVLKIFQERLHSLVNPEAYAKKGFTMPLEYAELLVIDQVYAFITHWISKPDPEPVEQVAEMMKEAQLYSPIDIVFTDKPKKII